MADREPKAKIYLLADNIRSAYNVGALFRNADCFGVEKLLLCGVTPYPKMPGDGRLPHVQENAHQKIAKTALGAEQAVDFQYFEDTEEALDYAKQVGPVYVLENDKSATRIGNFQPKFPHTLAVGSETEGVGKPVMTAADKIIRISQSGAKSSLNVSVACGIALFAMRQASSS